MAENDSSGGMPESVDRLRPLDNVDRAILAVLREDGRIPISGLADRINISRAAAYSRMNRLIDSGVITSFSASIDASRAGLPVSALVLLKAEHGGGGRWMRWRDELLQIPAIEFAFMVAGETDIVILVRARDQDHLRSVLFDQIQSLENIASTRTLLVLNEILHRPFVNP